jgi:hypothetical protein
MCSPGLRASRLSGTENEVATCDHGGAHRLLYGPPEQNGLLVSGVVPKPVQRVFSFPHRESFIRTRCNIAIQLVIVLL